MLAAAYPPEGTASDPIALAVLEETAEYLGAGLSDLINLFQPERILIGGWAGLQLGSRFLPAVRRYAISYSLRYPAQRVTVDLGRLGPDAVTVGAAILPLADFFARGGRRGTGAHRSLARLAHGPGGAGAPLTSVRARTRGQRARGGFTGGCRGTRTASGGGPADDVWAAPACPDPPHERSAP